MSNKNNTVPEECSVVADACILSRRCFMTGEYCSKQMNIQKEKRKLHGNLSDSKENAKTIKIAQSAAVLPYHENSDKTEKGVQINAFVIMNFSDMSDVVYKWRVQPFIETLRKYLYLDKSHKIHCLAEPKQSSRVREKIDSGEWIPISKINVIRADSNPATNYVMCNRVCQQLQIADLVIVDVSMENTNVFYEFGMAVALGKLILPICYSKSYYGMSIPDDTQKIITEKKKKGEQSAEGLSAMQLEHHIDCYPWRRSLFEYYGIRYKSSKDSQRLTELMKNSKTFTDIKTLELVDSAFFNEPITRYLEFNHARDRKYGFSDIKYDLFPYHERLTSKNNQIEQVGEGIYNRLRTSYNTADYKDNTLIVYTMDGFLNEEQAGQCIINFYKNITKQMKAEQCFCGDRVGTLIQENAVPEEKKDAIKKGILQYSVGDIIHIGMNQATYTAQKEKIKPKEFLEIETERNKYQAAWQDEICRFVKEHIRNRSMPIYPNNPVYVSRMTNGLQAEILSQDDKIDHEFSYNEFFCLYHVMLRSLKYTNEIVVDISKNSLQSLFWLGAAHASGISAITVIHSQSEKEKQLLETQPKPTRTILDVAGLWTAVFRTHDTEGFYRQLALAQLGIEQHSKLMLRNLDDYEERMKELLYEKDQFAHTKPGEILLQKEADENGVMESYYREQFWQSMLKYNRLQIYFPQMDGHDERDKDPRLHTVKWDVDSIAAISSYISGRKIVGEYQFKTLAQNNFDPKAVDTNFICVGDAARPLQKESRMKVLTGIDGNQKGTQSLAEYVSRQLAHHAKLMSRDKHQGLHMKYEFKCSNQCPRKKQINTMYKGFRSFDNRKTGYYTQLPQASCYQCMHHSPNSICMKQDKKTPLFTSVSQIKDHQCKMNFRGSHDQLAQLLLWREVSKEGEVHFWVSLTGASGPATLALSTIFVSKAEKKEVFTEIETRGWTVNQQEEKQSTYLLNSLQQSVRKDFIKTYISKLSEAINDRDGFAAEEHGSNIKNAKSEYSERVTFAAKTYLSTILYQFFLPFVSNEDIFLIYNGMKTYIANMMAAKVSPFSLTYSNENGKYKISADEEFVKQCANDVSEILKETLEEFRGVEAFYKVEVIVAGKQGKRRKKLDIDSRKILSIEELNVNNSHVVHCLRIKR